MTLYQLEQTGARDFARRDYIERTPLQELSTQLAAHFSRVDDKLTAQGLDRILGGEDICRAYRWTGTMYAHLAERQVLSDTTRLQDIRYRWIAVYPVTGSNEGHYVHVDLIHQRDLEEWRTPVWQIKTFAGSAAAIAIAGELCRLLGV